MAKKDTAQEEMFPQKKIAAIETAYLNADKKRAELEAHKKVGDGINDELRDLERTLRDTVKSYAEKIDHQETEDHLPILVYQKGDFKVVVAAHERLTYDKIRDTAANEPPKE